jgi:hypothetical protein
MADKSTKNIEDVAVDDFILAYKFADFQEISNKEFAMTKLFTNLQNNSFTAGRVAKITRGFENFYYLINNKIRVTFEHPIFVKIVDVWRFIEVRNLKVGYHMYNFDNLEIRIRFNYYSA